MSDHKFTRETWEAGIGGLVLKEAIRVLMENKMKSQSKTLNNLLSGGVSFAASILWNDYGASIKSHARNAMDRSAQENAVPHSVYTDHVEDAGGSLANKIWADHHNAQ